MFDTSQSAAWRLHQQEMLDYVIKRFPDLRVLDTPEEITGWPKGPDIVVYGAGACLCVIDAKKGLYTESERWSGGLYYIDGPSLNHRCIRDSVVQVRGYMSSRNIALGFLLHDYEWWRIYPRSRKSVLNYRLTLNYKSGLDYQQIKEADAVQLILNAAKRAIGVPRKK